MRRPYGQVRSPCGLRGLLRNIQQHSSRQEHHQQTRAAVADKRQRNPFRRHHAQYDSKINERLKQHHGGDAERQQASESVRRRKGRAQPTPAINGEERNDNHRAEKAQLLANDRVNKIGVRLRKIKELLLALHQANSGESSGADGDQRLQQLKAGALRIGAGIEKSHQPGLPVRDVGNQQVENRQRRDATSDEPLPRKSRDKEHCGGDQHNVYGGAEVRLQQNEHDAHQNRPRGGKNGVQEILFAEFHGGGAAALQVKKPCQIEDDGELRQFGRLNIDRSKFDPAVRGVRFVEEKRSHKHQQDEENGRVNHR